MSDWLRRLVPRGAFGYLQQASFRERLFAEADELRSCRARTRLPEVGATRAPVPKRHGA